MGGHHRWSEIVTRVFTPAQLIRLRARVRSGILVEYWQEKDRTWMAFVRGETLRRQFQIRSSSLSQARHRAREALSEAVGKTSAAELWKGRAETLPAGAEERERAEQKRGTARRRRQGNRSTA